jgi:hypothetical protein
MDHSVLRFCWILHSDLNTRFNILIEEFSSLQHTIYSLSEHIDENWRSKPIRELPKYQSWPQSEKSLGYLLQSLEAFKGALIENKTTAQEAFERVLEEYRSTHTQQSSKWHEAYFWFVAQRGHFIHRGLDTYTDQLRHAHEKLMQLVENMPGRLPHPLVLRRWNANLYESFLNWYARHVSWETLQTLCGITKKDVNGQSTEYLHRRSETRLTHAWSHRPTSVLLTNTVRLDDPQVKNRKSIQKIGTIESAFFYVEQPLLFPLIYHECAHLHITGFETNPRTGVDFLSDLQRVGLAMDNSAGAALDLQNRDLFVGLTEEVWADAIAVALCGKSYLVALALQIFGADDEDLFTRFEGPSPAPLNERGKDSLKTYKAPELTDSGDSYFWIARIQTAAWLCRILYGPDADDGWIRALELSCKELQSVGSKAIFPLDGRSNRDHDNWIQQIRLNDWAHERWRRYLRRHVERLRQFQHNRHFRVSTSQRDVLKKAVGGFMEECGLVDSGQKEGDETYFSLKSLEKIRRLEEAPITIRWALSGPLVEQQISAQSGKRSIDKLRNFADYARHDGSTAFRILFEQWIAVSSLWEELAKMVLKGGTASSAHHSNSALVQELYSNATKILKVFAGLESETPYLEQGLMKLAFRKTVDLNMHGIARLGFSDAAMQEPSPIAYEFHDWIVRKCFADSFPSLEETTHREFVGMRYDLYHVLCEEFFNVSTDKIAAAFASTFGADSDDAKTRQIRVGMLSFGHLQTAGLARYESNAIDEARDEIEGALNNSSWIAIQEATSHNLAQAFLPLFGDYHFALYTPGLTPVERDASRRYPKSLVKPRFVWRVAGNSTPLAPHNAPSVATVSLVRMAHRWRWMPLLDALKIRKDPQDFEVFLSSAWEDLVVIAWHSDVSSAIEFIRGVFQTHHRSSVSATVDEIGETDSFTMLCSQGTSPALDFARIDGGISGEESLKEIQKMLQAIPGVAVSMAEKTGRYDYVLTIGGATIEAATGAIGQLPGDFWKKVEACNLRTQWSAGSATPIKISYVLDLAMK